MIDHDSRTFRENIIKSMDYDIVVLSETFLKDENVVVIDQYTWIAHNREELDARAVRGSGGVGVLVHQRVTNQYRHTVVDKSHEGILWIKFEHMSNELLEFYICACYLPPDTSSRGDIQE